MNTKLELLLLLLTVPLMVQSLPENQTSVSTGCNAPYTAVGGKCISVNTLTKGSWHEMKNYCHQNGGRLITIDSADFLYYLVKFIKDNGLVGHNYWVGANNENEDNVFYWLDGTVVKMGTPFWGTYGNVQEPHISEHCGGLYEPNYFFMHGFPCTAWKNGAICESTSDTPRVLNGNCTIDAIKDTNLIVKTPANFMLMLLSLPGRNVH